MLPSDEQWLLLEPLFPPPPVTGRPPHSPRAILTAVAWKLTTAAPWYDLPSSFPPFQTCARYYKKWLSTRLWDHVIAALAQDLALRGHIDIPSAFSDHLFTLTPIKGGYIITFPPSLLHTWQLPTAILIFQHLAHRIAHPTDPLDPDPASEPDSEPTLTLATRLRSR